MNNHENCNDDRRLVCLSAHSDAIGTPLSGNKMYKLRLTCHLSTALHSKVTYVAGARENKVHCDPEKKRKNHLVNTH